MSVHPLEQLRKDDVASREGLPERLRAWSRTNAEAFPGSSLLVHGSLARGDYWRGGDVDLLVECASEAAKGQIQESLRQSFPQITFDLWRIDPPIAEFVRRTTEQRKLPSPMQFGLYGFDIVRHQILLLGTNVLGPFVPTSGADLVNLAKDRLAKLVTRGQPGHDDGPSKKAMEALKAAAIIVLISANQPPTRDKRRCLSIFLDGTVASDIPHETAIKVWSSYRYTTPPPPVAELDAFVAAVELAFR